MSEKLFRCPIARPYSADADKLTPKIYSLVRKCDLAIKAETASKNKKQGVLKGIKEIGKLLQSKIDGKKVSHSLEGALVVFGADTSPFDVLSHIPKLAEEAGVAYVWVPSRKDLGIAAGSRRPTSVVLLEPRGDYAHSLAKCVRMTEKLAMQ
ncbi:50S ribosomal protein L7Ae [Perkinsela sp. CCAP 1560/4]|nr:50S ribosomal protein L7Ae [Perkinsela sp. CCAP 1560/4]|eukprot:KNH09339.1 50S ribosomal protein L7Ae [Perkinsela sp. CCAP 1560/4]